MNQLRQLQNDLRLHADKQRAHEMQRFFKTGEGEYGHGDVFLGLSVPQQRKIAKRYWDLPLDDILKLLKSKIHEERFTALVLMVRKYQKGDDKTKSSVYKSYLANAKWINNWDLVDTSTPQIVGDWCWRHGDAKRLVALARSRDLWERRIGVLGTFTFIRNHDFKPILEVAEALLHDKHDLIHKAVGWMLREAYKRDGKTLTAFLDEHATHMPRTMLRYAIERMPEQARRDFLTRPTEKIKKPT